MQARSRTSSRSRADPGAHRRPSRSGHGARAGDDADNNGCTGHGLAPRPVADLGTPYGGKVHGRINMNTIQHPDVFQALFDSQPGNRSGRSDDVYYGAPRARRTTCGGGCSSRSCGRATLASPVAGRGSARRRSWKSSRSTPRCRTSSPRAGAERPRRRARRTGTTRRAAGTVLDRPSFPPPGRRRSDRRVRDARAAVE